jgi:hypothetical protein
MGAEEAIRSTGGMLSLWGGGVEVDAQLFLGAADAALANGDEEGCGLRTCTPANRCRPIATKPGPPNRVPA